MLLISRSFRSFRAITVMTLSPIWEELEREGTKKEGTLARKA